VANAAELRDWLAANHTRTESVWLVTYKKHVADRYVSYDDIVDEVLCFGWIDSLPRRLDADRTMLRLSPRQRGSAWSGINKARVARLVVAGRMQPAGLAKVEEAKQGGSWTFLDDVEAMIEPEDLVEVLARHPGARENFDAFPKSYRRGVLEWIKLAKRPQTRAKRIDETARLASENRKALQPG